MEWYEIIPINTTKNKIICLNGSKIKKLKLYIEKLQVLQKGYCLNNKSYIKVYISGSLYTSDFGIIGRDRSVLGLQGSLSLNPG